jgi:hypothetical protein
LARVGAFEPLQEALESRPELDGIGSLRHGGIVDFGERVVDNGTGASVALRDNTSGRDAQIGEVADRLVWQYQPLAGIDHIHKLGAHELDVLGGAFVGAALGGHIALGFGPLGGSCVG